MKEQNFKNHTRLVPGYHYVLSSVVLAIVILSFVYLVSAIRAGGSLLPAVLFILIAIALVVAMIHIRTFPLAAQDRTIRAEENLRHFVLTGKLHDSRLSMSQIIALRFAPDEEFISLAERAVKENLSNKEIKKAIRHWKADYHRV